ncbi:fibronectin type III domain-containing protein [Paenibacillus sp. FSL R10-2771]|uniref:fibronectin type III domain-containing protein n=1 Tax=Paenibacillus sp. FSL R10-2771 TaxID=2954693 RepID=UPI0030F998DB
MKQWKSIVSKLVLVIFAGVLFFSGQTNTYAAAVGDQLTTQEAGWIRYDDTDVGLKYAGSWYKASNVGYYNGGMAVTGNATNGNTVSFTFYGTKLRVIADFYSSRHSNNTVTVDGVTETLSEYSASGGAVAIIYQKTDLPLGFHTVLIRSGNNRNTFTLDAIDIDETGYLINTNLTAPIDLSAAAAVEKIDLSWTAVTNAMSYNIKRSITNGGPYETIASNVTNATYTDINVTSDVKYYYVVSAVNAAGESISSNEASAIPMVAVVPDTGRALLTIYLINGAEKEYDLSITEVNAFIDWFDQKDAGVGPAKYALIKTWNKGPFTKRTEYVVFDKILTFNVDEYSAE